MNKILFAVTCIVIVVLMASGSCVATFFLGVPFFQGRSSGAEYLAVPFFIFLWLYLSYRVVRALKFERKMRSEQQNISQPPQL